MIELNKTYKLKKILGFLGESSEDEYKILSLGKNNTVCYEPVSTGGRFLFMTEFIINPEKPKDIYYG